MKKAQISTVSGAKLITDEVVEILKKSVKYPIITLENRSKLIDGTTNDFEKQRTMFCTNCNHKFVVTGTRDIAEECPNCKRKSSGAVNYNRFQETFNIEELPREFEYEEVLKCDHLRIEREHDGIWSISLSMEYNPEVSNRRNYSTNNILIPGKVVLDGETFFLLKEYSIYLDIDMETMKKKIVFVDNERCLIFTENEVVKSKDGSKTVASLGKILSSYYYSVESVIIAPEKIFEEMSKTVARLCENRVIVPICKTNDDKVYILRYHLFDSLTEAIKREKSLTRDTKKMTKKDIEIMDITSSLPELPFFAVEDTESVYYKVIEIDDGNSTITASYTCPKCKGQNTFVTKKYSSPDVVECEHCKCYVEGKNFKNCNNLNETTVKAAVIQDYKTGIVVREGYYNQQIFDGYLSYRPIKEKKSPFVFIISEDEVTSPFSDIQILKYNSISGKYGFTKSWYMHEAESIQIVHNGATKMASEWSAVEKYCEEKSCHNMNTQKVARYMMLYKRFPVMEKLTKEVGASIVDDVISKYDWERDASSGIYKLKENTVPLALKLTKQGLKALRETKTPGYLYELQALCKADANFMAEFFEYITRERVSAYYVADVCEKYGFTVQQVCEYLERVRIAQCVLPNVAISEWKDYLEAVALIGSDMNDRRVKYPAALRTEHDKVVYKKNIIENANFEEKFKEITEMYGKEYACKGKDFIITYPKSLNDLFEEGRELHHCVGTYGDAIKRGDSIILFVRKAKEPDKPYFTLEIQPRRNAVTQFYGYSDTPPHRIKDKELISFIKEWAKKHDVRY